MEEILQKQKKNLVVSIKEAELREKKRLMRLTSVKNPKDHEQLLNRFTKERGTDQDKIECLTKDYYNLKQKFEKGEFSSSNIQQRKTMQLDASQVANMPMNWPNRFAGVENREGEIFYSDVMRKFNAHDKTFEMKQSQKPFDKMAEVKKLRLLDQKRQVLQKLINVQTVVNQQAAYGDNMSVDSRRTFHPPTSIAFHNNNTNRPYDTQSTTSGVSALTYATFATERSNPGRMATRSANSNNSGSKRALPPIPRLNLSSR